MIVLVTLLGAVSMFVVCWSFLSLVTIMAWRKIDSKYFGTVY